jgi:hypothetical protein
MDARAINKSKQTTYTPATRENEAVKLNEDGSSSLEDLFGLGSNQLRELMEQELPVPREDLITRKEVADANVDKNKVFKLPDLSEFMDVDGSKTLKNAELEQQRVDRRDKEAYYRVLQLNPFADADDTMFLEEVRNHLALFNRQSNSTSIDVCLNVESLIKIVFIHRSELFCRILLFTMTDYMAHNTDLSSSTV